MTEILNHLNWAQWIGIIWLAGPVIYLCRILIYWSFLTALTLFLISMGILTIMVCKLCEFLTNLIERKK